MLLQKCPCCESEQIRVKDTIENLKLMECTDCSAPDFYIASDNTIWIDGCDYTITEFKKEFTCSKK